MFAEMEDTSLASTDGTEDRVPGEAMAKCFPAGGILLVSVSEGDVYPSLHIIQGTFHGGSLLDVSGAKGGVAEAERLAAPTVGGGREGILARMAEEEETEHAEVCDGFGLVGFGVVMVEVVAQGPQDGEVDGPDSSGAGSLLSQAWKRAPSQ